MCLGGEHKLSGDFEKGNMKKDQKVSQKIYKHSSWFSVYQISSGKNFPFAADLYYNNTPNNWVRMLFLISLSYHCASETESQKFIKSPTMVQNIQKSNAIFNWENSWKSIASPQRKSINMWSSYVNAWSLKKSLLQTFENWKTSITRCEESI